MLLKDYAPFSSGLAYLALRIMIMSIMLRLYTDLSNTHHKLMNVIIMRVLHKRRLLGLICSCSISEMIDISETLLPN